MFDGVMKQILSHQLLVPIIHEKNVLNVSADSGEKSNNAIDFSRPSDYRTKAIKAEQMKAPSGGESAQGPSQMSTRGTESSMNAENTPGEGK